MLESGPAQKRIDIAYFEGVNSLVSFNVGKKTEFVHAENARSKTVGTIEKREGQTVLGTKVGGSPFVTSANYGLFPFQNVNNQGLYRISALESNTLAVNVSDVMYVFDSSLPSVSLRGIIDGYDYSNYVSYLPMYGGASNAYQGQSFSVTNDTVLSSFRFYLAKQGSPSGTARLRVYNMGGTFGSTSIPVGSPLLTLDFSLAAVQSNFVDSVINLGASEIRLTGGVKYVVVVSYTGGDANNYLKLGFDSTSPTHGGNWSFSPNGVDWSSSSLVDLCFFANGVGLADSIFAPLPPLSVGTKDQVALSEQINNADVIASASPATIYYINSANQWTPLTGSGTGIPGGIFDYTYAEGCAFLVNQNSENRYIGTDGTTVTTASSGAGHLYNTPPANRINYYKNRLYLADFVRSGVRYKTTVLRSSYPMGIISLLNADYTNLNPGASIDVTDTKYFYTTAGANTYDVYRGTTLIKTITVTAVSETSITASWTGTVTFLASDEIWIAGTYNGPKVFRWVTNPTITGKDIKQYDTFKLSGGENDEITMLTNIGNVEMISNKTSMASWNDYTLENFDLDFGCVSKKGYVKMLGTLYFLHYTGIYSTTGGVPQLISNKIEKYITGATKSGKESCAAGKKGRSIFFTLGDVTLYKLDGSINKVLHDVCVEYNLTQQNWFVHTNVPASEFATFVEESDSDRLEFTETTGNHAVKEFLSGETDDGEAIHFRVDTMKLTTQPNNFEYSSKLIGLLVESERGAATRVFVNLENNEEYYAVDGTVTKGLSVIKITDKDDSRGKPPYCRLVSFSLRDSSKQICKLSRMSLIYLPTTDENATSNE